MNSTPIPATKPNPEWKPSAADAPEIQGIVVSAYPGLLWASTLMVQFPNAEKARAWLQELSPRLTFATGPVDPSLNLALSAAGMAALGLPAEVLATFSHPFQNGMTVGDRPRFLGDTDHQAPELWAWTDDPSAPNCVHAQLMVYASSEAALLTAVQQETMALTAVGLTLLLTVEQQPPPIIDGIRHEHFGFPDGLTQPVLIDGTIPTDQRTQHEIAAGEVVLGQVNTYGVPAFGPSVDAGVPVAAVLPDAAHKGDKDLGRNGTYLVVRQLQQDVAGFWNNMAESARLLVDESGKPATEDWLAAKAFGRNRKGQMLHPDGPVDGNDMTFFQDDRAGFGCPVTSHIRRANPRLGLAPADSKGFFLNEAVQATNRHRLMRRGRVYGQPLADRHTDDGAERGVFFACLNSEIDRQFEFVQHTWLLNPMFGGAYEQTDPILGPRCPFSIPSKPVRQQPVLQTFVTARGGGYFFLPSRSALQYLAAC